MRIYIASSWQNKREVLNVAFVLREGGAHQVYCFCEEDAGHPVFDYRDVDGMEHMTAAEALCVPQAAEAFEADKAGIDWADAVVLLLPAGRSSHLEAGYAVGQGKELFILDQEEKGGNWDVMYGFATGITGRLGELLMLLESGGEEAGDA